MTPETAREVIATTAVATIYAVGGVVALVAAQRSRDRKGRASAVLLGWALLQHAVNQMTTPPAMLWALGGPSVILTGLSTVTSYLIAVPWALLIERMIGAGWRSTVRRAWQCLVVAVVASLTLDLTVGVAGASLPWNRVVVGAAALVDFANLLFAKGGLPSRTLRAGILVFMALVVHDELATAGWLPWRFHSGPLGVLICVAAIAFTTVARTLRARRELKTLEHELATATRIQSAILPAAAPRLKGAELASKYVPAASVAGDMFVFLGTRSQQIGILVADVSGHGISAALIASMVKVAAVAQTSHAPDPARVLAGIHLTLADELPPAHFVTATYAFVDLEQSVIRYASAGHPAPVIWHAGSQTFGPPTEGGPLIMNVTRPQYRTTEVHLSPGDRVVMYTDGLTEIMRPDGEMLGEERLRSIIATAESGADRVASTIIDTAVAFRGTGTSAFQDDCTLVVVQLTSL